MSGPTHSTAATATQGFTPTAPAVTPSGQAPSLPLPPAMGGLGTFDATTGAHDVEALALWLNARPSLQRRLGDRSLLIVCEVLPIDEWEQADPGVRDVLATEMASRLTSALRASDFLVRIEGPWFAAVIDHAAGSNLQGLLDRFERILNTTVVAASRPYPVSGRARALEVTAGMTPEQALDLMVAVLSDDPT